MTSEQTKLSALLISMDTEHRLDPDNIVMTQEELNTELDKAFRNGEIEGNLCEGCKYLAEKDSEIRQLKTEVERLKNLQKVV